MKKTIWIIAGLALTGLVVFKLATNKRTTEKQVYHYDKGKLIAVQADTVRLKPLSETAIFSGSFEPNKETKLSAEVQGKINAVLADVGSHVIKGQPLIQLDHSLLDLQLRSVEVQIEGLEDDVRRYTVLAQADAVQGVQLEKSKLGLKSAMVQKATIQEQIAKSTIRAPFSGVVTAKFNEEGGFAAPGMPLLQITDIGTLRFTVNIPESALPKFSLHKSYSVTADAFPDISLNGKVIMIGSKANAGNSFPVQLQAVNTKNLEIKSGMFGKVNSGGYQNEVGILIPSSAVMESGEKTQVYVVKDGKAVLQTVSISKPIGNNTVIKEGLNEGDAIVTNGFINLFDGANVSIKN